MRRPLTGLGLERRARDVTPDLHTDLGKRGNLFFEGDDSLVQRLQLASRDKIRMHLLIECITIGRVLCRAVFSRCRL